jgi:hypothetical protein
MYILSLSREGQRRLGVVSVVNCITQTVEFEISTWLSAISQIFSVLQAACLIVVTLMGTKRTNCKVTRLPDATMHVSHETACLDGDRLLPVRRPGLIVSGRNVKAFLVL